MQVADNPRVAFLILVFFSFLCVFDGAAWGGLGKTTDSTEAEIRRLWKGFSDKKKSARVQGNYPYMDCFVDAARKYNLPVPLLVAMARGESGFDPDARSHKECLGLMQIKWPGTANDLGILRRENLFNPAVSIDAGARYLSWLLEEFDGDMFLAVAAYNYGPNAISPKRRVPSGAKWYAAYIFRHLKVVLSKPYVKAHRELIMRFESFDEAAGFASYIERAVKELDLEIQASKYQTYDVYFTYKTPDQRDAYLKNLKEKTGIKPSRKGI
jgi:hypothetical protein